MKACSFRTLAPYPLLVFLLLFGYVPGYAHETRPAVGDILVTAQNIVVSMQVNVEALISEVGVEHQDSDDSPVVSDYDRLRQMASTALEERLIDYLPSLLNNVHLYTNEDARLSLQLESISIPPIGNTQLPRDSVVTLVAAYSPTAGSLSWRWDAKYGAIILRAGETFSEYVQPGQTSKLFAVEPDSLQSDGSSFIDYAKIGFEHIIPKGLDHILFVVGLFLLAPRLTTIGWQISVFTLAHSVTLAICMTGLINLPASVVEPLIALSITAICIENLAGRRFSRYRIVFVFLFGLLHGLGFAGVLADIGLEPDRFFISLLAFNIGVELGQLTVVALCIGLAGWRFGHKHWYRTIIAMPASLMVGAVGLFWFFQRIGAIA